MNNNVKRFLALVLCLTMVLPLLPVSPAAADTTGMNKVEAEDKTLTYWNGYSTTENNTNASGGVQVGGSDASKNVYYADLKEGVDLSNTAYIKWTVNAPQSGNYDIAMRAHIQIGGTHSGSLAQKVYVTFFVNGKTPYKAAFKGENGWVYDTETVSVALNEGNNEIIAIPLVKDIIDANNWGWANADCLYLDSRLTAGEKEKEPVLVAVEAENPLYADWNTYTKTESNTNCSGGVEVGGGNTANNIAYADLQEGADLSKTAYVKWTVNAPAAGEYTVALRYHPYAEKYGNNKALEPAAYAAFFVNGETAYQAEFLGKSNWIYDTEKIKITLAEGDNEIIVIPMVKELLDAYEGGWANVDCLYIEESLTPVMNRVEAEDTAYAVWNGYSSTENRTDSSGGVIVGGASHGKNIAYANLKKDADLSDTAYIQWFVEAPADGEYAIALRYLMKANGKSNGAELEPAAYAAFFVNGENAYQAEFLGKNGWVYDTQTVMVSLKKGVNEIVAIPLVKEVIEAQGSSWANVDCLYLDNRLAKSIPEEPAVLVKAEAEDTYHAVWNNYASLENRTDSSGGVIVGGGKNDNNVLYGQLTEGVDLSGTAYVKWVLNAPEDGKYEIGLRYLMKAGPLGNGDVLDSGAYAAFFVGGKTAYKAKFLGKNNWVYDTETIEVTLQKGDNEIIAIPVVKDLLDSYGHGWANVDCLYYEDTLTLQKAARAEAEDTDYAGWNNYTSTEENTNASGGVLVGGGDASKNIAYADLKADAQLFDTSYVKWTVKAPADGEYTFSLRYSLKAGNQGNNAVLEPGAYAAFYVNGTAYQAAFLGKNGWVYDTQDVKITLKKGENEIIAIPITAEQVEAYDWAWANVDCLYYDSRLTVGRNRVEAEDNSLTAWNIYSTPEKNSNASAGMLLGGGDASKNVAYAALKEGVRLNNTSYVLWQVNAPADGDYTVALRYNMKAGNQDNNVELIPEGYAAFFVNGEKAYKAEFLGLNSWVYDTEFITLSLKAGVNDIVAIPLVSELVKAYNWAWANVDCLYLDGRLTVLPAPEITDRPTVMVQVEAEDSVYTYWNSYNQVQEHNSASAGKMAAGSAANQNVYYKELKEGVELSNTAYVSWTFDAPSAGFYTFKLRYNPRAENIAVGEALNPGGYAAFFVNGKDAYQAAFEGKNNWVYDTKEVSIYLNAGLNEVIAIPMVKDLYDAWGGGWANVDCLYYDSLLTLQKAPVKLKIEAEDRSLTYWNGYNTQEPHNSASGGYQAAGSSAQNNVYYKQLKKGVDLTYTAYVKWIITAPEEGDYSFTLRYAPKAEDLKNGKALTPEGYAAFFVNGSDAYKAAFLGYNNWVYNTKEISIHLKKGDNEIIAIPMVKDLYDAWGGGWANVDCLYIEEGLTVKPTGYVEEKFTIAEAEDLTYVQWNLYNTTENHSSATNKLVAAGSNSAANIYAKDLVSGADLSGTAYLKWTVIAPADGTYTFKLRYTAKEDGVKNGDAYENGKAYATFFVNDADVYTAPLSGFGARCNWLWDTDSVKIKLQKGENTLYVIPLMKDQYDAWGGGWANVDCLKMDTRLSLKKAPVYTRFEAENSEYNLYEGYATYIGLEDWGSAFKNDVTFDNLNEETIVGVSHVKYYVHAEKAGTYRIGLGFRQGHNLMEYTPAFFGLSVNLKQNYKVPFTATNAGNSRLQYIDVELQEGDNYIYCTACLKDLMDYPNFPSQKGGYVLWIDHDYILLPEGLTSTVVSASPQWTGDDQADYNQSLLSVWGDLTGTPSKPQEPAPAPVAEDTGSIIGWIIGLSAGTAAVLLLIILLIVKKKKKEEETV